MTIEQAEEKYAMLWLEENDRPLTRWETSFMQALEEGNLECEGQKGGAS